MAALHDEGPVLVRVATRQGMFRFLLRHAQVELPQWQPPPEGMFAHAKLTITGRPIPVSLHKPTLHEALADAILDGDEAEAHMLADDILEKRARPEGFVERVELLKRIGELERALAEASRRVAGWTAVAPVVLLGEESDA